MMSRKVPSGAFLFIQLPKEWRTIHTFIAKTLISLAIVVPVHHQQQHNVRGCKTHACDVRVGRAWAQKHPKIHWQTVGASIYGEPCEAGSQGYRGFDLNAKPAVAGLGYLPAGWSFAELDMGSALGELPSGAAIAIESVSTGRKTIIVKNDIGGGGGDVEGYPRAIDLYAPVAKWLAGADCNWTGLVRWHRL